MQQRQPQMAAVRFPQHLRLLPDRRRSPSPFAENVNQVRTPQMHRVLPKFLPQLIGHTVNVFYLFRLNRIVKQSILRIGIRLQVEKDNPRCPVNLIGAVTGVKQLMNDPGDFQRTGTGPGELSLAPHRLEALLFQKHHDFFWCKIIAPGLDAGRFHIAHELGEQVFGIGRWRCKRLCFAD